MVERANGFWMIQNTAAGQSHPWLWTLLKGELPCRSTQLQAVAKLNRSSTCYHFISASITVKKIYLHLVVQKLGDKASLLALHSDSVLEGGERDIQKRR